MVDLLPPVARGDIATKRDLRAEVGGLRSEMQVTFAELRSEIGVGDGRVVCALVPG